MQKPQGTSGEGSAGPGGQQAGWCQDVADGPWEPALERTVRLTAFQAGHSLKGGKARRGKPVTSGDGVEQGWNIQPWRNTGGFGIQM